MKQFVRRLSLLLAAVLLLSACGLTAFAAPSEEYAPVFTAKADILKDLGLFLGTGAGYELERVPTRAEAATMLVRLLGAEAEAKAGTYAHPFTDLPGWVDPYVGYLYEAGLTKGTADHTFSPETPCDANMYATFLLRALGYSDAQGDFAYETALTDAGRLPVLDQSLTALLPAKEFRRDDLAALSYAALSAGLKDGSGTLLDKLLKDGAVDAAEAAKRRGELDAYAAYRAAQTKLNAANEISASVKMDIETVSLGVKTAVSAEASLQAKGLDKLETAQAVLTFKLTEDAGEPVVVEACLKDGWLYVRSEIPEADGKIKLDLPALLEAAGSLEKLPVGELFPAGDLPLGLTETAGEASLLASVLALEFVGVKTENDRSVVSYLLGGELLSSLVAAALESELEGAALEITYSDMPLVLTYDAQERLRSMKTEIGAKQTVTMDDVVLDNQVKVEMTAELQYPEDGVKVVYPDLTDYTDVTALILAVFEGQSGL
jgi:hypothetical protein